MSARRVIIINRRAKATLLTRATVCASFFSRLTGLLFKRRAVVREGAVFVLRSPSRVFATVHTMGMRCSIGIVWLDVRCQVVDTRLAKPWRLAHVPKASAMYYLEADPAILEQVQLGDPLQIDEGVT